MNQLNEMLEFWPFAISGYLMSLLYCVKHKFRTMYANVLKFHILIPHEKMGDPYFFSYPNCGQAVLESSSVRVRQMGA